MWLFSQSSLDVRTTVESVLQPTFVQPVWLKLVLFASALALALGLYHTERGNAGRWLRSLLACIRFLLIAIVLWMLAGMYWQRYQSELPELIFVVDTSASMQTKDIPSDDDSEQTLSRWEWLENWMSQIPKTYWDGLQERYQLRWFDMAGNVRPRPSNENGFLPSQPDGENSLLGQGLTQVIDMQIGRPAAAIIFLSDGINTAGTPLSEAAAYARRQAIPIHALVIGQKLAQPDVRVSDLLVDDEVYLGDQVAVQFTLNSTDIESQTIHVNLLDASSRDVLDQQDVKITNQTSQQQLTLSFEATRPGKISLEVVALPIAQESNIQNNSLGKQIHVQDKTLRVLLVAKQPSYEFRFLKNLLQRTRGIMSENVAAFEVHTVLQESDPGYVSEDESALRLVPSDTSTLADYDAFVFDNVAPELISQSSQQAIFDTVTQHGSGCLFVCTQASVLADTQSWPLGQLLPYLQFPTPGSEVLGHLNWKLSKLGGSALPLQLARTSTETLSLWSSFPALGQTLPILELKPGAQVLATAADMQTRQEYPVLISQFAGAGRVVVQATDESYRLLSFSGTDLYYERYWGQMLRWLARGRLNSVDQRAAINIEPRQSRVGQPVNFEVILGKEDVSSFPESCELLLHIDDSESRTLQIERAPTSSLAYQKVVKDLKAGEYRATLLSPLLNDPPSESFSVTTPLGEQANLRADWDAMKLLATQSRGKFYLNSELDDPIAFFRQLPSGTPSRLGSLPPQPVWNNTWITLLFVLLISTEWIIRRRVRML
ncbi:MAG: hypothetical protein KDB03_06905 [Planctomycetales bacterium]|nr:hypothetical protein [Planctomycetales bacterium]